MQRIITYLYLTQPYLFPGLIHLNLALRIRDVSVKIGLMVFQSPHKTFFML